jgi:hypothetical protein
MTDKPPFDAALRIGMYVHCRLCGNEVLTGKMRGKVSPADYARFAVGWTQQGLQVWCNRHNVNVLHIDFEGHQHPAITGRNPTLPGEVH